MAQITPLKPNHLLLIENLIQSYQSDDPHLQTKSIMDLVDQQVYAAISELLPLLKSPHPAIRANTAYALGYLGINEVDKVGSSLMQLLSDPEEIVRSEVVSALGDLAYIPAKSQLESLLIYDPSALVRAECAETLGLLGDPTSLNALELAFLDLQEDEAVRGYAVNSMGLLGTSELLSKLESYIQTESSLRVKAELLATAYYLGAKDKLDLLLNLLNNADENLSVIIQNILADLQTRREDVALT